MADDGYEQLARLKKLAQELDAAKSSVDETVKHITSAQHGTEKIIDNTVVDPSKRRTRKRRASKPTRKRKKVKKANKAKRRR